MTDAQKKLTSNELKLRLNGKIDRVEHFDTQNGRIYETIVVLPAKDSFTSPNRFVVRSTRSIGVKDTAVDLVVFLKSRYWKASSGKVNYSPEMWLEDAA